MGCCGGLTYFFMASLLVEVIGISGSPKRAGPKGHEHLTEVAAWMPSRDLGNRGLQPP